ncbi:hypothetical protein [Pseudoxanthomonas sp.]|uniref:hypothetical protein n=1 Tax=Pseudoxanthomonas sp. TaxID=1871049 RepID=UPI002FDF2EA4
MKRIPLFMILAAGLVAASAHAQTPAEPVPATPPTTAQAPAGMTAEMPSPAALGDDKRLSDINCLRETGSRITKRDGKPRCTGQPGRSYTKDDLDRTGHTNLGDALRALDPAVR